MQSKSEFKRQRENHLKGELEPLPNKKLKRDFIRPPNVPSPHRLSPEHTKEAFPLQEGLTFLQFKPEDFFTWPTPPYSHKKFEQKNSSDNKQLNQKQSLCTFQFNSKDLISNQDSPRQETINGILCERKGIVQKSNETSKEKSAKADIAPSISYRKQNIIVTRGLDFVPVDNYFPMKDKAKVLEHERALYSATLTQSNLAKDDNKFFIIQALQIGDPPNDDYYLYTRWGRVGVRGQVKYSDDVLSKQEVIRQYHAKSQEKVKRGGYKMIDVTYDQGCGDIDDEEINKYFEDSRLPWKVQELVRLIFDRKMMHSNMKEIGYDEKRSPLGLISKKCIDQGYIALNKIMQVLKDQVKSQSQSTKRRLLNEYSSEFYSAIPHDFGYMKMQAFVLNSEQKVKQKLEMLASLSQIRIYSELMGSKFSNPGMCDIDIKYFKLKCNIQPLESKESERWIRKYIENTHASTHDKYSIEIVGIFQVRKDEEISRYRRDIGNKMMLWHGSRLSNYVGILSEGLKIAPFEAPATGYMFGKGIYFADIVSKSANYCKPKEQSEGLMLLCEVAIGTMNDKLVADFNASILPSDCHSTRGLGKYAPSCGETIDGVFVPNGPLQTTGVEGSSLLYNEYVVYNRDQVVCRYIVHVKFHFK